MAQWRPDLTRDSDEITERPTAPTSRPADAALIKVFRQMRAAQKAYYAEPKGENKQGLLIRSRQLEATVDAMLAAHPDPDKTPDLFDSAPSEVAP